MRIAVSEGEKFVYGFRAGIAPAAFVGGAVNGIVIFRKRNLLTLSVNLGSGRHKAKLAVASRLRQHVVATKNVRLDRLYWGVNDLLHAYYGC